MTNKYKVDNHVNIIWLSDIHFKDDYSEINSNDTLNNYINDFHNYLQKLDEEENYDYLLISGDIAQKGLKSEYDLFKERVLHKVIKIFPKIKLLIVPGNHDVNRLYSKELTENFINNIDIISNRPDFIKNKKRTFKSLFKNYNDAFKNFRTRVDAKFRVGSNDHLLGYVLDKSNRTIFILLNSSWYSLGDGFLENYLEQKIFNENWVKVKKDFIEKINKDERDNIIDSLSIEEYITNCFSNLSMNIADSKKFIEKNRKKYFFDDTFNLSNVESFADDILQFKKKLLIKQLEKVTNEYGKQVLGLEYFENRLKPIINILKKYNDFVVVTVMHHPINWLDINERVPYKEGTEYSFNNIKKYSDILITGHEHVPNWYDKEVLNDDKLIHLKAGCFMEEYKADSFKIDNNWFSTLSINTIKKSIKQHKHIYTAIKKGSYKWETIVDEKPFALNKKRNSFLSEERNADIRRIRIDGTIISKITSDNEYSIDVNKKHHIIKNKLYILIGDDLDCPTFGLNITNLKNKIRTNNILKIYLLFFDKYHHTFNNFCDTKKENLVILDSIKKDIDFKFDKFRCDFFNNLNENEAKDFINIKFGSKLIPFWELDC